MGARPFKIKARQTLVGIPRVYALASFATIEAARKALPGKRAIVGSTYEVYITGDRGFRIPDEPTSDE